jgi:PAS domain S-box-containing protein
VLHEDAALRFLLEGTARETGAAFFRALVQKLAEALATQGAWVTEYDPSARRLRALAFWLQGQFVPWEAPIDGTPCEKVVEGGQLLLYPDRVLELYPDEPDLGKVGAVSYLGVPLKDVGGEVLGHLAVLDTRPMPEEPRLLAVFRLFADRAAAELRRLRAETAVREREDKLARVIDGAMDAIVELDEGLRVTHVNAAGERVFGGGAARLLGREFATLLAPGEAARIIEIARAVPGAGGGSEKAWISGGVRARTLTGDEFPAEGTLSAHAREGRRFYTLVLRNVDERIAAEAKISSLAREADYLREELRRLESFEGILGKSPALVAVLRDVEQVAGTDASVLILGETGTGKELVARAIHEASERRSKPLVRVNCAAIPANLVESELFGHQKGAFTGASEKREGRFALADGGTVFLDELGELSLDVQAKLLRVLQEGEFEPVGSSRTRKVDVRVLSATNRDLHAMMKAGTFREDLYYRLSVFPIRLPPLRERGADIGVLAEHFAAKFARKMGRTLAPLSEACKRRLAAYDWPGNVRELANVIERAVITAREGCLNLDRAIPDTAPRPPAAPAPASLAEASPAEAPIYTAEELLELERENLRRALEAADWKVAGPDGAASRLGLKPSTLSSRMRALGVRRPPR